MTINWQSYDEKFFQRFCNALLSLEVSKGFVPFSASGRDGGIDGLFTGAYDEKAGSWRFQDKFHKTERKTSYSALKKDVVNEIKKLADEDHYILLTNVELLPRELKELLTIGKKELKLYGKEHVTFNVWDGAKIDTLYVRHPILRLWVEDGFSNAQLLFYQDYFGRRLQVGIEDPATLANEFIARQSDLDLLSDFLTSPMETIAVVAGEAGIGKTRLVIEFFQTSLNKTNEWQTLVLNTHEISRDKISFGLSGNENIVILIDDAHGFAPSVIADLRNLLRLPSQRKLKFILTGRRILIDRALELIPAIEHNTIKQISLSKLSKLETTDLFSRQQNIKHYKQHIPQLVFTSNGRPILIVALLRAIHENIPIPQIKSTDVLKKYVGDYFNTVINVVAEHSGVSKLKLELLLRVICLLEPLPLKNDVFYKRLAEFTETPETELRYFLKEIEKEGLAYTRYEFVITPDYYSDILLASADATLVLAAISKFPDHISNAIVNLSGVDEANEEEGEGRLGLEPILLLYIQQLPDAHQNIVEDIMVTVSTIAYQKPAFAKMAVALLIERLSKPESERLRSLMTFDTTHRSLSRKSVYGSVSWLLHDLLYRTGNENFVFESIVAIHNLIPHEGLFQNTFALGKRHVMNGYAFNQPLAFVTKALEYLKGDSEKVPFFIQAFKDFLQLEFTTSGQDPLKPEQINLLTFYLPSDPAVIAFRTQVIDGLIMIYKASIKDEIKTEIVHELMDIPRAISASKQRSKSPYINPDEIIRLLEFIKSIAATMPLSAHRIVIDSLYWTRRWGTEEEIVSKIKELEEALKPTTLTEKLLYLINRANTRLESGYNELLQKIKEQATALMKDQDALAIAESLSQVQKIQKNHLEYFWPVNQGLFDVFAEKAMAVYDQLWITDRAYIHQYGAGYLWSIRFKHGNSEFYWKKIGDLETEASFESTQIILNIYFRIEKILEEGDNYLIERLYKAHGTNPQLSLHLLMAFGALMRSGFDKSPLLIKLFDVCPQSAADKYLIYNREAEDSLLKELLLHHTVRLFLSFEIQHGFSLLSAKRVISEDELFDYLIRRFEVHSKLILKNQYGYDFIPRDNHNPFGSTVDVDRIRIYMRALRWYVVNEWESLVDYHAKDILEFLHPSKQLTTEMADAYRQEINNVSNSRELHRLLSTLDVFESKTKLYVELVVQILNTRKKIKDCNENKLRAAAKDALTAVGVKSGTVGVPFEVDVRLRQLLTDWMADHPDDDFINTLFKNLIGSLDQEIKRSTGRPEPLW